MNRQFWSINMWFSSFHDMSVHLLNLLSYNWICNANIWVLACHCDMAAKGARVLFLFFIFSLVPSKILPSKGTEWNKSWTILQWFFNNKIDQNNFLCVSVPPVRVCLRERVKMINEKIGPKFNRPFHLHYFQVQVHSTTNVL